MFSFHICQNSRATVTYTQSIKFSGLWPGKIRATTILLHLCLSLKQVNKNPVLMKNYWRKTPQCSTAGCPRAAGIYKGLQCDQKTPNPSVQACTHAENSTLLITSSVKKINHTFETRNITRVCDEPEQASWYTGDHCLSSLSFFLQRESTWQYNAV